MVAIACPSVPYWQPALGRHGECVTGLAEVAQSLEIILNTPLGACPMRPHFGCDLLAYLDQPLSSVQGPLIREITQAITQWEPRVKVEQVRVTGATLGHLTLSVLWRLKDDTALQTNTFSIGEMPSVAFPAPFAQVSLEGAYLHAGVRGCKASTPEQPGAEYFWSVDNGTILSGQGSPNLLYASGEAGNVTTLKVLVQRGRLSATSQAQAKILPCEETLTWTTCPLAPKGGQSMDLPTGKRYLVTRLQTSAPARVRLYQTSAKRSADRDRTPDIDPIGHHGELFDSLTLPGVLNLPLAPWAFGAVEGITYAQVDNADTVTTPITVTLHLLRLEP